MVAATVAELHLIGFGAEGQGDHLVAQADAEDGQLAMELPDQVNDRHHILRVARAVGQEQPVRGEGQDGFGGGVVGHHGHVAAEFVQLAHDVQLDAAVHRHHVEPVVGRAGVPLLFAGNPAHLVGGHLVAPEDFHGFLVGRVGGGDQHLLASLVPDDAGEPSGVHALDAGDAVFLQDFRQRFGVAEVGGHVVVFPHDHAAHGGGFGFVVLVGDAVVADQRIGHHHRLGGVAGVGHDFLIPRHGRVEHDLVHRVHVGPEPPAQHFQPVFHHDLATLVHCSSALLMNCHFSSLPLAGEGVRRGTKFEKVRKVNSRLTDEVFLFQTYSHIYRWVHLIRAARTDLTSLSFFVPRGSPSPARGRLFDIPFTLYSFNSSFPLPRQSFPPPWSSPHPRWFPSRRRGWRCPWRRTAAGRWCRVYLGRSR